MYKERLLSGFRSSGFSELKTNILGISILRRENAGRTDTFVIVDNSQSPYMDPAQIIHIRKQLETRFAGDLHRNTEIMFLILSDNLERDRQLNGSGIKFWILDVYQRRLVIYEDQPEDYARTRAVIEQMLAPEINREELKMTARKQKRPIVNFLIVAANVIVFILMEMTGSTEDTYFMLNNGAAFGELIFKEQEYYRLFTSTFIHFGAYHLLSNMITLLLIGGRAERILGSFRYLLIYLASGVGASLFSSLYYFARGDMVVSGGASGAIFGVIGALLVLIFKNRKVFGGVMRVQFILFVLLILYNGFQNIKVDIVAHLAGLVLGILFTHLSTKRKAGRI